MPDHESKPAETGIRESDSPQPVPAAWQPLTFRGVAAFSRSRIGRLLTVQCIVSLIAAAGVLWSLHLTWLQRLPEAIRALPPTGSIENQILNSPRTSPEPLAADGFISISINLNQSASRGFTSDVRVEFHRTDFILCSLLGCLKFDYPNRPLPFNQPELEAWWGAWRWTILTSVVIGTIAFLMANWILLATCYALPVWLIAYFKDRELSLIGGWKLASAGLLTPALILTAGVLAYAFSAVDLLRLLLLWCIHIPLGWVYIYCSILRLPVVSHAAGKKSNPFAGPRTKRRRRNPFTGSNAVQAKAAHR